jgi:hypothetical protein
MQSLQLLSSGALAPGWTNVVRSHLASHGTDLFKFTSGLNTCRVCVAAPRPRLTNLAPPPAAAMDLTSRALRTGL